MDLAVTELDSKNEPKEIAIKTSVVTQEIMSEAPKLTVGTDSPNLASGPRTKKFSVRLLFESPYHRGFVSMGYLGDNWSNPETQEAIKDFLLAQFVKSGTLPALSPVSMVKVGIHCELDAIRVQFADVQFQAIVQEFQARFCQPDPWLSSLTTTEW